VDCRHGSLSIHRQCALLGIAKSGVCRPPPAANDNDLSVMPRIDELFTAWPFLGSRRVMAPLRAEGHAINRKRVQRLMRKMGIPAPGPSPRTTKSAPGHKIFPYLFARPDHRPTEPGVARGHHLYPAISRGFLYLVAIMDWLSRAVLAWRLWPSRDLQYRQCRAPLSPDQMCEKLWTLATCPQPRAA
jgi:putative transposase